MSAHSLRSDVVTTTARSGRAAPLPPDERRRAILRAVAPVVLERGLDVTTRRLAEVAGVAEGTLFRVFADKESLVREAAYEAADPAHVAADLAGIDVGLPLEDRLVAVVEVMGARIAGARVWMTLVHRTAGSAGTGDARCAGPARHEAGLRAVHEELARLLAPDAHRLRCSPAQAAQLLHALVLGSLVASGRGLPLDRDITVHPLDARGMVGLLLDGLLAPGADVLPTTTHPDTTEGR